MISGELSEGVLSQTTTLVKTMKLPNGDCRHTNIVKVMANETELDGDQPRITSHIQQNEPYSLKRLIQICYQRRKYLVQDVFHFTIANQPTAPEPKLEPEPKPDRSFISSSQKSESGNSPPTEKAGPTRRSKNRKVCIFQKKWKAGKRFFKRNTKNIPKNFCKAFVAYMEQSQARGSEEWKNAMRQFRKMEKKGKYNNILIQKMLSKPRIAPYFKDFLDHHAAEWINHSKIADKDVHLEAIRIYLDLLDKLAYAEVDPSPSDQ